MTSSPIVFRTTTARRPAPLVDLIVTAEAVHFAEVMLIGRRDSDAVRQLELRLLRLARVMRLMMMVVVVLVIIMRVRMKPGVIAGRRVRESPIACACGRVLVLVVRRQILLMVPVELALIIPVLLPDGRLEGTRRRRRRSRRADRRSGRILAQVTVLRPCNADVTLRY